MPTKAKNGNKKKKKKKSDGGSGNGSVAGGVRSSVTTSSAKSSTEAEHASSPIPPWVAVEQQHKGVRMSDETKELVQIDTIERACNAHDEWTARPDKVMEQLWTLVHRLMVLQRWHGVKNRPAVSEVELTAGWDEFRASPQELPPRPLAEALPNETWERLWGWVASRYPASETQAFEAMRSSVAMRWMGPERGHGVVAARDIKSGDVMMRVPEELMLSPGIGVGKESLVTWLAETDPLIGGSPTLALALLLAHEKLQGDESAFAPYIALLPSSFSIPFFWRANELSLLAALQQPRAHARALNSWRMVAKQFCYVTKVLRHRSIVCGEREGALTREDESHPRSPERLKKFCASFQRGLTFEVFRWAMAAVITRQNEVPVTGSGSGDGKFPMERKYHLALIPIWDMCNHAENTSETYFEALAPDVASDDPASGIAATSDARRGAPTYNCGGLVCRSLVDVAAGDEVCIFYGRRPNSELLCYSGFVHKGSAYDQAEVSWELYSDGHPNPKLLKTQLLILKNLPGVFLSQRDSGKSHRVVASVLAPKPRLLTLPTDEASETPPVEHDSGGMQAVGEPLLSAIHASCIQDEGAATEWLRSLLMGRTTPRDGEAESPPSFSNLVGAAERELLRRVCKERSDLLRKISCDLPADWPPISERGTLGLSETEKEKLVGLHAKLHADTPRFAPIVRAFIECEIELLESVIELCDAEAQGKTEDTKRPVPPS